MNFACENNASLTHSKSQSTQAEIKMDYLANLHSWTDNLFSLARMITKIIRDPFVLGKAMA